MFKDNSAKTLPVTYNLRKAERKLVDKISDVKGVSKSEIVRDAIKLYAIINDRLKQKQRLAFVDQDGNTTPIEMIWADDVVTEATREEIVTAAMQAAIALCPDFAAKELIYRHSAQNFVKFGQSIIDSGKAFKSTYPNPANKSED